tara:strand:+ start:3500 stop:4492 length:993 start_codon:yes stop_codon:yes gene_type:complete
MLQATMAELAQMKEEAQVEPGTEQPVFESISAEKETEAPEGVEVETVSVPEGGDAQRSDAEPEADVSIDSERFARLARRERSLRQREAELNSKLSSKPKEAEVKKENKKTPNDVSRLKEIAGNNPLELLQEFGLTYTDIANAMASDPDPSQYTKAKEHSIPEASVVEGRVAELEERLRVQQQQSDAQAYETSMVNFLDEIQNFVDNGQGKYELVQARNEYPMVAEVIQRHHQETGKVMAYEQAASRVEDYLLGQVKQFAGIGSKKIAELFLPKEATTELVQQEAKTGHRKTLTQKASVTPVKSSAEEYSDKLTKDESLAWLARNMNIWGG